MKALFIKDFRLILRQQRGTIFLFLAVVLLMVGAIDNPMFGIIYTVFFLPSLLISTIAYDIYDNGMPYIMALPVSMKQYVAEKYLLTVGGSLVINILATSLTALVQAFKSGRTDLTELLVCSFVAESVILIYSAVGLPVNMRYGTEKGRVILIIMAIAIGAFVGGSKSLLEAGNEKTVATDWWISQFGVVELLMVMVFVCIVVNVISYLVCVKWMEKKQY